MSMIADVLAPNGQALPVIDDGARSALASILSALGGPSTTKRVILDYDGRTDSNPVYVGKASQSTLVAATTWEVLKLFYDGSGRLVDSQVITGSWTGRAALAWKSSGGD